MKRDETKAELLTYEVVKTLEALGVSVLSTLKERKTSSLRLRPEIEDRIRKNPKTVVGKRTEVHISDDYVELRIPLSKSGWESLRGKDRIWAIVVAE